MATYTDVTDRRLVAKTPAEIRPLEFDFTSRICKDEVLSGATITLYSPGSGLTVDFVKVEDKKAWGMVSEGTAGTTYVVRATITTKIGSDPTGYTYTLNRIVQVADV